ncbi:MAG: hypothetical protein GVY36_12450 [Verrucomicrobia bacterium]|nr:hypothetical protein [Verrucomicrobiota bacterium]
MIPTKEMKFEDPALGDSKAIVNIIINPDEEYYFIYLGEEKYKTDEACVKRLAVFKDFGWKVV